MDFDFTSLFAFILFGLTIGVVYGIVALEIGRASCRERV
jgi:hypothetical protein